MTEATSRHLNFAFWSPDNGGEWIVENHGVDPDYVVPQRPDLVVSGRDRNSKKPSTRQGRAENYKGLPPRRSIQSSRNSGRSSKAKLSLKNKKRPPGYYRGPFRFWGTSGR